MFAELQRDIHSIETYVLQLASSMYKRCPIMRMTSKGIQCSVVLVVITLASAPRRVTAHGETALGTSGGAINTIGANLSPAGTFNVGTRFDWRQFGEFSDVELRAFARRGEDVHMHAQEFSVALNFSWTFADDWAIDAMLPYNMFANFREGIIDGSGNTQIVTADFTHGLGDLLLLGRFRPLQIGDHSLVMVFGLKLPTGNTRQEDDSGERLGGHNQPGSGSIDVQLGAAYTWKLGAGALSADAIGFVRTEGAMSYQAGNSLHFDLAGSYPISFVTFVLELNGFLTERDIEADLILENTGAAGMYVSPGLIFQPAEGHAVFVSFSVPAVQSLGGIQNDERFRASFGYNFNFGAATRHRPPHDSPHHGHEHHHHDERHDGPPHH